MLMWCGNDKEFKARYKRRDEKTNVPGIKRFLYNLLSINVNDVFQVHSNCIFTKCNVIIVCKIFLFAAATSIKSKIKSNCEGVADDGDYDDLEEGNMTGCAFINGHISQCDERVDLANLQYEDPSSLTKQIAKIRVRNVLNIALATLSFPVVWNIYPAGCALKNVGSKKGLSQITCETARAGKVSNFVEDANRRPITDIDLKAVGNICSSFSKLGGENCEDGLSDMKNKQLAAGKFSYNNIGVVYVLWLLLCWLLQEVPEGRQI
uniref:Uncharacterized protein n=1 Tax=Glossina brevipalpis TaxID=37001 RepID=A0A1A9WCW6_9MUSC